MFSKKSQVLTTIVLPISFALISASARAVSPAMMMPESSSAELTPATPIAPSKDPFRSVRQLVLAGDWKNAQREFSQIATAEQDGNLRSLALVGAAHAATELNNHADAQSYLTQAEQLNSRIQDHVQYLLGISYQVAGDTAKAKAKLKAVLDSRATPQMSAEARFHLGEIAFAASQWREAQTHFTALKSKIKTSDRYPQVIYNLMMIERKLGRGSQSCRWARELYSKYPSDIVTKDFKFDLQNSVVAGQKLGCPASRKDQEKRIRRLQWAGASDRALQELITIKNETRESERYQVDSLIANHLVGEGQVDEALKLLLPYNQSQGNRTGYLLLLAKVASRAGQPQAAVGAYEKAYKLSGRSKTGRTALFQAAFMSYQFQDYDGASRKFEEFVKLFGNTSLARDASWHLAWIRYLKGDYQGAMQKFSTLAAKPKGRRGRRTHDSATTERSRYWMAMSLMRLERYAEARQIFQTIAKDSSYGYYSMLSNYRLETLPVTAPPAQAVNAAKPVVAVAKAEAAEAPNPDVPAAADEESEEQVAADTTEIDGAQAADEEGEEGGEVTDNLDAPLGNSTFNDPYLSKRFERARDLSLIGLDNFARQELYEIERRTRSANDRRTLMGEYQSVQSYHRSSYLGDITFGMQRVRAGMKNGRILWEFAYPRAYDKAVAVASRNYSVPEEMIWGIMRAESNFKYDAQSPVGARGLMQLMPFTSLKVADLLAIKAFDVTSLVQPEVNIKFGTRYLSRLMEQFQGSLPLVAASYNAGPHRAQSWLKSFGLLDMDEFIEHIPFIETRNYVKRVMRNCQIYELLYAQGNEPKRSMKWLIKPVNVKARASTEVW